MAEKYSLTRAVTEPEPELTVHDYTKMFVEFSAKYRNVFMVKIKDDVFIYRALGRAEYREILEDRRFSDLKKEELICTQCLLYPNPDTYNWDDKEAGIPTELMKAILTDSYLDSNDRRRMLHEYYRAEMFDIDNKITCLISEAFPNIDIEEIEAWDVEKTTKYLSRAEWIIQNLHHVNLEGGAPSDDYRRRNDMELEHRQQKGTKKPRQKQRKNTEKTIRGGERKDKLTPDKLREREEFFKKYPEFAEAAMRGPVDDISHMDDQETVDTTPPALRVGW